MALYRDERGFALILELLIVTALVGVIATVVYRTYQSNNVATTGNQAVNKALQLAAPAMNGITITTPTINATVGTSFTLAGTAPPDEPISVTIDDRYKYYIAPEYRNKVGVIAQPAQADNTGQFSILMDLTGSSVVENRSPDTYATQAIGKGKHTFFLSSGLNAMYKEGPSITLTVR